MRDNAFCPVKLQTSRQAGRHPTDRVRGGRRWTQSSDWELLLAAALAEPPLDVEADVEVASSEPAALIRGRHVLVGVRRVVVGQQDLEVVAADRALQPQ